jgi:LmbE family N-acetylglucosaminyl deacetylase
VLPFVLGGDPGRPLSVLCLGAHSDDIEIGAGGTLLRLVRERPGTHVHWVIFSADGEREDEARSSAADFLEGASEWSVTVHGFRESYFPFIGGEIKDEFEPLKSIAPDVVFTHRTDDAHQDHRIIGQLTWNTFRDHAILEYEIPKYEGDLGQPNLFAALDTATAERKIELLMKHFGTQRSKRWFRASTFRAMMNIRGIECNSVEGFAEAFHVRKMVV